MPGLQENPFLQQQARFQYPPGLHQEQEKEQEQERPRMHNGKKVSNININISMVEYSEIFLFPGPQPPYDLLECPVPAAGAEVPADSVPRPAGESRAGLCPGPGLRSTLSMAVISCLSLYLYGIRIGDFHALKGSFIGAGVSNRFFPCLPN